jgi:hypothetical protein
MATGKSRKSIWKENSTYIAGSWDSAGLVFLQKKLYSPYD